MGHQVSTHHETHVTATTGPVCSTMIAEHTGDRRANWTHIGIQRDPPHLALPSSRHRRMLFTEVLRAYGDGET